MDILPLHIEYLLTRHDCVIVPGLGAFIATETEAEIDLEAGIIRPCRREIGFNSSVVTDDGLLTHSIARREGLSYEEARRLLAHLTERMISDLNQEWEVSLGMVGKLVKDSEGLISFKPRQSAILSDIMQELKLSDKVSATAITSPEQTSEDFATKTDEEEGMRTIRVKADRYVFTVSKRAVHAAAMLVAIITIGLSLLLPVNHDNQQKASVISIEDFFHHTINTDALRIMDSTTINAVENDSTATTEASSSL
ncbi:MAG: hypothetical protein K2N25_00385 [Muribaculaceae bacterium]|nr:hypothetical protein [Muribaculaceae bacterium]